MCVGELQGSASYNLESPRKLVSIQTSQVRVACRDVSNSYFFVYVPNVGTTA